MITEDIKLEDIYSKVKEYILEILSVSNEDITTDDIVDDLNELQINSVDYLEFIIKIENNFDIDIPDEMLVENNNNKIQAWADFIYNEIKKN